MHKNARLGIITVCLLVWSISLSGCEPLHKKFTRKKKEKKEDAALNPILDPIDYPPSRVSALEKYQYHYSLWQVWNKDLLQLLTEPTMDKRKNYLFTEITQQLQEMKKWISEEKLPKLEEAIGAYDQLGKELEKPSLVQNKKLMENRMRRMESFMKTELKPETVFPTEQP